MLNGGAARVFLPNAGVDAPLPNAGVEAAPNAGVEEPVTGTQAVMGVVVSIAGTTAWLNHRRNNGPDHSSIAITHLRS